MARVNILDDLTDAVAFPRRSPAFQQHQYRHFLLLDEKLLGGKLFPGCRKAHL